MNERITTENWRAVMDTLLNKLGIPYQLTIDEDNIHITASNEHLLQIKAQLETMLQSTGHFYQNFPYKLFDRQGAEFNIMLSDNGIPIIQAPKLNDDVEQGKQVLRSLFSKETIDDLVLEVDELFDPKDGAYSSNFVLFSKPALHRRSAKRYLTVLEGLLEDFQNVSVEQLREIWMDPNRHLPHTGQGIDDDTPIILQGLAQQCFNIDESNGKVRILFNYGLLQRFVFPPAIESSQDSRLTINKAHFGDYVRQLSQDGALIRVIREHQQSTNLLARLLYFGTKQAKYVPHQYTLILDRSSSMSDHHDNLGEDVLKFIEKLKSFDHQARVRIVYFSGEVGPVKEFSVSESWEIRSFIKGTNVGGTTRLLDTIRDELEYLINEQTTKSHNTCVVVFTDGQDNASNNREVVLREILNKFTRIKDAGQKLPKFFTMGLGKYDHDILSKLSGITGVPLIHLQTMNDFDDIYNYLSSFQYNEKLLEFLVKTSDTRAYSIPIRLDGNAQSPNILIPFQEKQAVRVETDGKQLWIMVEDANAVPVANFNDRLHQLRSEVNHLLADVSTTAQEKAQKLSQVQTQTDGLSSLTKGGVQQQELTELRTHLQTVSDKLARVIQQGDQALYKSLQHQAQYALGYTRNEALELATNAQVPHQEFVQSNCAQSNIPLWVSLLGYVGSFFFGSKPSVQVINWDPVAYEQPNQAPISALEHVNHNGVVRVFPKTSDCTDVGFYHPSQEWEPINFDLYSNCQPVYFHGQQSVVCEGEKTTLVYTPNLSPTVFDRLNGQLLLGLMAVKYFTDANEDKCAADEKLPTVTNEYFEDRMKEMQREITNAGRLIDALLKGKKITHANVYEKEILQEFRVDLSSHQRRFDQGKLDDKEFVETVRDVRRFVKKVKKEHARFESAGVCGINEPTSNVVTHERLFTEQHFLPRTLDQVAALAARHDQHLPELKQSVNVSMIK